MCNKCNNTKHCGCEETNICGCTTKLDLKCLYYDGITLDPLNIIKGMNGEQILQIINDYIKDYLTCLDETPTIINSVGNKIEVYKGLSDEYVHEIKSLFNGDGIIIEDKGDYIEISINTEWFKENVFFSACDIIAGSFHGLYAYKAKSICGSDKYDHKRPGDHTCARTVQS